MDRTTFEAHLQAATKRAVEWARQHVRQPLFDEVVFRVYPNQSYDGNPRVGDEIVFPEESLPDGKYHGPWSAEEVVSFLWRDSKVPEWINIAVETEDDNRTIVALRCCGRFTAQEKLLYHRYLGGVPPFSVKSPNLPPGWESIEVSGKFDLDWQPVRPDRRLRRTAEAVRRFAVSWFSGRGGH